MILLKQIFLAWAVLSAMGCLSMIILYTPFTYRFIRSEFGPFDWPVWVYQLRRSVRLWWLLHSEDVGGILVILAVMALAWVGMVITA